MSTGTKRHPPGAVNHLGVREGRGTVRVDEGVSGSVVVRREEETEPLLGETPPRTSIVTFPEPLILRRLYPLNPFYGCYNSHTRSVTPTRPTPKTVKPSRPSVVRYLPPTGPPSVVGGISQVSRLAMTYFPWSKTFPRSPTGLPRFTTLSDRNFHDYRGGPPRKNCENGVRS